MTRSLFAAVAIGALLAATSGWAASAKSDFGKREYDANCAVCHGPAAKGDGPYKPYLQKIVPDLTTLAKRNGGVFPMSRVHEVIDGRATDTPGHGTRDMPIWGRDYLAQAREDYMDVPYDPEAYVRTRIFALIDYLHRLQAK